MRYILTLLFATPYFCQPVFAVTTKTLQADTWKNNALTKTWTPPSITDTLAGLADIQTFTNKVINGSNNTITNVSLSTAVTGTLPITSGGTGQTSASAAFDALAPSQGSNSGKYLTTNGTTTSWGTVDALPSQGGNNGKYLTTDGSASSWSSISLSSNVTGTLPITSGGTGQTGANAAFNALAPSQTSNSGKFLTTNGTDTSWATAALTAQGQSEGSGVTTTTIKSPYNQITTTGTDTRLIETGYNNLLLNPSFEGSTATTSWTQGSGTSCAAETTEISDGAKSLLCTLTAATAASIYQDVTPTVKMSGINFEYGVWIKTASTTLSVCARQAAATVGSCTTVIGDNSWHYYPINYPGPSSGSVGVSVVPLSSTTGTYYIDAGYVGKARNIGTVAQASFFGGMEQAGASSSCNYSENTSSGLTDFIDLGAGTGCNSWTTTGSVVAVGTNDHRLTASNMAPGQYEITLTGGFFTDTQSQTCSLRLNDGTNTYQPQSVYGGSSAGSASISPSLKYSVSYSTAQSSVTFKLQAADDAAGSCSWRNGITSSTKISWKIYYFPSAAQTVVRMDQVRAPTIQKLTSGSGTYTTPTGVTHINVRMVGGGAGGAGGGTSGAGNGGAGGNTTFGTSLLTANGGAAVTAGQASGGVGGTATIASPAYGTAIQGGGGGSPTGTGGTGLWASGGVGAASPFGGQGIPGYANAAGTNAIANTGSGGGGGGANTTASNISGAGGGAGGFIDAYITLPSATYSYAIGAGGSAGSAGGGSSSSGTTGGSGYIEVTEYYGWNMPLLVGGVTSNTTGMERVERARITGGTVNQTCASSPCTVYSQSGSWTSGVTRSSTGIYVFTFTSAMFSAAPSCVATGENGAQVLIFNLNVTSATAMTVNVYDTTGTARDAYFNVLCQGPR